MGSGWKLVFLITEVGFLFSVTGNIEDVFRFWFRKRFCVGEVVWEGSSREVDVES